jgi:hypothetical protein
VTAYLVGFVVELFDELRPLACSDLAFIVQLYTVYLYLLSSQSPLVTDIHKIIQRQKWVLVVLLLYENTSRVMQKGGFCVLSTGACILRP